MTKNENLGIRASKPLKESVTGFFYIPMYIHILCMYEYLHTLDVDIDMHISDIVIHSCIYQMLMNTMMQYSYAIGQFEGYRSLKLPVSDSFESSLLLHALHGNTDVAKCAACWRSTEDFGLAEVREDKYAYLTKAPEGRGHRSTPPANMIGPPLKGHYKSL